MPLRTLYVTPCDHDHSVVRLRSTSVSSGHVTTVSAADWRDLSVIILHYLDRETRRRKSAVRFGYRRKNSSVGEHVSGDKAVGLACSSAIPNESEVEKAMSGAEIKNVDAGDESSLISCAFRL